MSLSPRLAEILAALPLRPGLRVLEIGSGTGALARAIAECIGEEGFVLGIDRSATAIAQSEAGSAALRATGRLAFRKVAVEDFARLPVEARFDLAVAVRVGALDGRHPEAGARALPRIAAALVPGGRLIIDGVAPMREVDLSIAHGTG
jgi:SAM-dependent methyltransferase